MKLRLSQDARPQAMTLLVAAAISVLLWFIPYAEVLTYPFRIFVTFIHEGGHAIAALLTGNSVASLSVAMNASGETAHDARRLHLGGLISSAGYLGSMAFGALLLVLIRKTIAARIVLLSSAVLIFGLTIIFGLIKPVFSFESWSGIPFTLFSGIFISVALVLIAKFASARVAMFFVSFLAVQCVLNAHLRSEDTFLPLVTVCADGAHRCREHGRSHRHSGNSLGRDLDRRGFGNFVVRDADVRGRTRPELPA